MKEEVTGEPAPELLAPNIVAYLPLNKHTWIYDSVYIEERYLMKDLHNRSDFDRETFTRPANYAKVDTSQNNSCDQPE